MQLPGPSIQHDGHLVLRGQSVHRAGEKLALPHHPVRIVRGHASQRTGRDGIFPHSAESSDRTRRSGCDLRGCRVDAVVVEAAVKTAAARIVSDDLALIVDAVGKGIAGGQGVVDGHTATPVGEPSSRRSPLGSMRTARRRTATSRRARPRCHRQIPTAVRLRRPRRGRRFTGLKIEGHPRTERLRLASTAKSFRALDGGYKLAV